MTHHPAATKDVAAGRNKDSNDMEHAERDVGWDEAAWVSSIAIAVVIVAVGITFFVILILTSMR